MTEFIIENKRAALFAEMGLGKTATTLTAIRDLMFDYYSVRKVLILAPLRVALIAWPDELAKWDHTNTLTYSVVYGEGRQEALEADTNIHIMSYSTLGWLVEYVREHNYLPYDYDIVVFDESSYIKNRSSQRWTICNALFYDVPRKILLTGTPSPNGLLDLWGQIFHLDHGMALGSNYGDYKRNYFISGMYKSVPMKASHAKISKAISNMAITLKVEDYLKMPDLVMNKVKCVFSDGEREEYDTLEKDTFLKLDGKTITAFNAATVSTKLRQYCQGFLINDEGGISPANVVKIDALKGIVDDNPNTNFLIAVQFKHEMAQLRAAFGAKVQCIYSGTKHNDDMKNIADWNKGKIQILAAHPACLHPSTKVLTEHRGWVKLVNVKVTDRVFDGEKFVSHEGCVYSGEKNTIDVMGLTLTPNHKLFINEKWVEVKDVRDSEDTRRKALYEYSGADEYLIEMFALREGVKDTASECAKEQSTEKEVLSTLYKRNPPQHDWDKNLESVDVNENKSNIHTREEQELCLSWYRGERRVAKFQKLLRGHARGISGASNTRTNRRGWGLRQRELQMGYTGRTTGQQKKQPSCNLSRRADALSKAGKDNRCRKIQTDRSIESRYDSSGGGGKRSEINLQWRKTSKKEGVYDLVNCGPRNRFLIKNNVGEVFVSHNSIAHGLNLQEGGYTIVWLGLPWSLEHFQQFIARLHRQGQKNMVMCHMVVVKDTIDDVLFSVLTQKGKSQDAVMESIKEYRKARQLAC